MTAPLTPAEQDTLHDLAMWQSRLRCTAGVKVTSRWLGENKAPVPAHSAAFYRSYPGSHFRWQATDDSGVGGAIGLLHWDWRRADPSYGFGPDEHFMIADRHNDQAMAFFRYREGQSLDDAEIVGATAGDEGDARFVAGSIQGYVRRAIEARFGDYWFARDGHATTARAWVDTQPLDPTPQFEVTVASVEPPDAAVLRALSIAWLPARLRGRVAAAAGIAGDDGDAIGAGVVAALAGKPASAKKVAEKLAKVFVHEDARQALFLDPVNPDLRVIRLRARRVGTAFMLEYREWARLYAAQLLLDAPGAEAIAAAVDADRLRFCAARGPTEARKIVPVVLVKQPDKGRPASRVAGEVEIAALVPAALVPVGCVAGARFTSIAPAQDGVGADGRVLKSE